MPSRGSDSRLYVLLALSIMVIPAPFLLEGYLLDVLAAALLLGLFAAAVDLSLGYLGVLNLGSALYFALGAYAVALTQQADIPFAGGLFFAALLAGMLAFIIGAIGLKRQKSTIQFALLGLVASLSFEQIIINSYTLAGGSNGIANIRFPSILGILSPRDEYFYLVAVVVIGILFWLITVVRSQFGALLLLIRDEPDKAASLGYDVDRTKVITTVITAILSSVAGALYVPLIGIAYPAMFSVVPNMLVLVWIAIGGMASLVGPFLFAVALKLLEFELGSRFTDWYLFILGLLFIVVVTFNYRGAWAVFAKLRWKK